MADGRKQPRKPAGKPGTRGKNAPTGLRIIAGEWRGRRLTAPRGEATRPSADRTRETMFNMLTSRIGSFDDLSVADLFAGSGALGIEALSRGAQSCLFVEREAQAVQTIRDNLAALDATARAVVRAGSALDLPPAKAPHDLILLDPPYDTGAVAVALERLSRMGWIGPATWIALETGAKEDAALRNLEVDAVRRVGSAQIVIARLPGGWTVHPKHRIRKRPPSGVDGGRPIREPFKESQVTRSRN